MATPRDTQEPTSSRASTPARLRRAFEFVRHIPARKMLRRLSLTLSRRWSDRRGGATIPPVDVMAREQTRIADGLLFSPRAGARRDADGWTFSFLHDALTLPVPLDWRSDAIMRKGQLWRMNLHYMEYLETLDDDDCIALMESWRAANDPPRPGAWRDGWNSYALSLRAVVWMQQLSARSARIPAERRRALNASLARQIAFLENNLETDLGGNHLVKNIKALILAATYFGGPAAQRWRALGLRLLRAELAAQILPDGMHDERSPSYHAQVFADCLECRQALGADPFDGALDSTLLRMAQVLADLAHPDGLAAQFNDAGLRMAYAPADGLRACARLLHAAPAPRATFALPQAGYYGARDAHSFIVVDAGRIAPDDLPAHGHGDVFSFEWSLNGRRFIVDQGVYEYVDGARRKAARASAMHNTLSIAGLDQADFFGAFRCGVRPDVTVHSYEPRAGGFTLEASHDGFRRTGGGPLHRRRIEADPRRLLIVDRLEGARQSAASFGVLLAPDVRIERDGNAILMTQGQTLVRMTSDGQIAMEQAVWWPDMGVEHATHRLRVTMPDGAATMTTRFEALIPERPDDTPRNTR